MGRIVRHRNPFCMSEVKWSTFGQNLTAVSRTDSLVINKENNFGNKGEFNLVRRIIQRVKLLLILD